MDILRYIFENGCSQQKDISSALGIDKSNLNRIMNNLADNDLVVKLVGPKCAFFELSANGYTFVRQQAFSRELPTRITKKSPLENRIESFKKENKRIHEKKNLRDPYYKLSVETKPQHDVVVQQGDGNNPMEKKQFTVVDISMIKSIAKSRMFGFVKGLDGEIPYLPGAAKRANV